MPATSAIKPELLAPAGDRDCLKAAIENGADAVYFGLSAGFNARARATNFTVRELPELIALLHQRGVKGYVTLNTLVFPSELPALEAHIRAIAAAGTDAVLVQDLGVARLIKAICPELVLHASTQMTLTSAESIRFAADLGIERVVLPRELSVDEIAQIHSQTDMPLEAFVHGALCVAYSGQCLTSESLGGRSANRGQCAQACRLPYEVLCDDQPVPLGDVKYLLSPQDLAAYDLAPQLIDAGVISFKIEGRLKTPEYVANITRHYREAIDTAYAGQPVVFTPQAISEMELSFSRGFSHGWLDGCNHKVLVEGRSSDKRGVLQGHVQGVHRDRVVVKLAAPIKRGDGLVFATGDSEHSELGGRVYEVFHQGRAVDETIHSGIVDLGFKHGSLDFDKLRHGVKVWKTDDPELTTRLRKSFTQASPIRRLPIDLQVVANVGEPLRLAITTASGLQDQLESATPLALANKHALSAETLRDQLGRLGGTAYELRNLTAEIIGSPMMPFSLLGKLRHELIERLDRLTQTPAPRNIASESQLEALRATVPDRDEAASSIEPVIHVLCRSLVQLRMLLERGMRSIYVDFADIREYREAVELAHAAGAVIYLATPRIQKPDEAGIFRVLLRHGADGMLVRNLGGLRFYHEERVPMVADFSLNCTNELTAQLLMEHGVQRITASYDLNRDQLNDLVGAVPPHWLEVVVHQHMPMFHMEHCVFCAVLSPGTNKTNCGRPCDTHRVELKDRLGVAHPLQADVGCRNTLFNAVPQSAAEAVPSLLAHHLRHFRLEVLTDPTAEELDNLLGLYRDLLAGRVSGKDVWTRLKASNRVGVTRGTLEERRNPLAIL
ncbi:MAG TPA: DUF3656 domain-containing protein [Pirellulaceae bacterium]|nr:DUF3656 domain-containing protein [Pirellulaceae bacterium]